MCGLVGIAGDLRLADEFSMKRLLLADYFRGPDSTGMAAIATNGDIKVAKIASNPIDLFDQASFRSALNGNGSRAFIGHNRFKTKGKVSTANAHPFHVEHIVGAHNGTLDTASHKRLEEKLGEEFDVDSLALFTAIAKFGIEETIGLCTEGKTSQDGAWALTWYDQDKGTLNFLRNKHRTLFYSHMTSMTEGKYDHLMWASEWWMIRETMESSVNGKYKIWTKKEGKSNIGYFSFDPDVLYSWDLAELKEGGTKPVKPKCKKLKGREPEPVKSYVPFQYPSHSREGPWPKATGLGTHTGNAGQTNTTLSTTNSRGNKSKEKTVIELTGNPVKHPYANIIDEDKFNSLCDSTGKVKCGYCETVVKFGDPGVSIFEREGKVLCRDCMGYPKEKENPPVRLYVNASIFDALQ